MQPQILYDDPALYDRLVPPGPCEAFYGGLVPAEASVLELGCGTGRLTLPLARGGRDVTGLDVSRAMLSAAREKAVRAGLPVRWVEGDMAAFDLGRRFDLIVVSCNSLAHLTSDGALADGLRRVREHLAPGGVFAFDVPNPDIKALVRPEKARVRRAPPESGLRLRETARYDQRTQVRDTRWRVHDRDGSSREVGFHLRQFFPADIPRLLDEAGLRLTHRFGDFERSRFMSRSRLQVCLATQA